MDLHQTLFFIFAVLILVTAGLVAFRPRPIESALWLILNFFLTAGLYVVLGAHFTAIIQILVYAGAIMVLFVFVILLLNLDPKELGNEDNPSWASMVLFVGILTFVLVAVKLAKPELLVPFPALQEKSTFGSIEALSSDLLYKYYWGFELAGVILLMSIVGVGLLAYRKRGVATHRGGRT